MENSYLVPCLHFWPPKLNYRLLFLQLLSKCWCPLGLLLKSPFFFLSTLSPGHVIDVHSLECAFLSVIHLWHPYLQAQISRCLLDVYLCLHTTVKVTKNSKWRLNANSGLQTEPRPLHGLRHFILSKTSFYWEKPKPNRSQEKGRKSPKVMNQGRGKTRIWTQAI